MNQVNKNMPCIAHLQANVEWGGGENQVFQLLSALQKRNINVGLWAHADGVLYQRALSVSLPVHTLPYKLLKRFSLGSAFSFFCKQLKAERVGLIHVHDSKGLDLGIRLRRRLGVPLVYSRRISSPIRSGWLSQRKYTERNIDAVLAISETVRNVMLESSRFPKERIFVAATGVDPVLLDAMTPDDEWRRRWGAGFLVGGLGRLAPKKNWEFLVRVAAACRKSMPDIRWVVAGEGPDRQVLTDLSRKLAVDDIVHFIGFQAEGTRILKSLDLLFFPSLREGASVTIREAMLMGVPVAAMNAPGSMESLGGHGWVLEPDGVERAVVAVQQIREDHDRRRAVIAAAREFALKRFTFDRTTEDTIAVYRRLLGAIEIGTCTGQ